MKKTMHPLMRYLKLNQISVVDFSAQVGMSRMNLYRIMNGETTSLAHIISICEAAGNEVTANDFAEFSKSSKDEGAGQ